MYSEYTLVECCECHIHWAQPEEFDGARLKDHKYFYCPSGHAQHYTGKNTETVLKEELKRVQSCCDRLSVENTQLERSRNGYKGVIAREVKKRKEIEGEACAS